MNVSMLRANNISIPELEGVEVTAESFDAPTEDMGDPVPFMYQSGYLTIKGYDPRFKSYRLGIPNAEVAEDLSKSLMSFYTGRGNVDEDWVIDDA